jgi:acetyl-CoA carboxylase carboxyl transferase subunit beta
MDWFRFRNKIAKADDPGERHVKTEGLWIKCDSCRQIIWRKDLVANNNVCSKCNFHFKIGSRDRLDLLFDGQWMEHDANMYSTDPLSFVDSKSYTSRLASTQKACKMADALVAGSGTLTGRKVQICSLELKFIGGSTGSVMGEKITRAIERSLANREPLIIVSATGGARMQEGVVSLMQMAKISAALMLLDEARIPFISVLTDPTTGGVTASFAMLGDLNIAEPGALIGFAGPRVIEQTIRQKLPEGFQRSEFLLQHGFLDAVVSRNELKAFLARSFEFFCGPATERSAAGNSRTPASERKRYLGLRLHAVAHPLFLGRPVDARHFQACLSHQNSHLPAVVALMDQKSEKGGCPRPLLGVHRDLFRQHFVGPGVFNRLP